MDIVFGKHGWRQIPYYRKGEKKMVEVPKEDRDEADEIVSEAELMTVEELDGIPEENNVVPVSYTHLTLPTTPYV